jgi:hypothetical protein
MSHVLSVSTDQCAQVAPCYVAEAGSESGPIDLASFDAGPQGTLFVATFPPGTYYAAAGETWSAPEAWEPGT